MAYNETPPTMKGPTMNKFFTNLKKQAEENPLVAIGVATVAVTAVTKLMQANTERTNSRTWEKEVDRRRMSKA
jgi:hypothetical protein